MKRVVVLVNKDFEYAGFIEGLRDIVPVYAGTNGRQAECRFDNLLVDIYCIQNLFGKDENSSNSEVKYGYLKELFKTNAFRLEDVDAVLSVSTAETTPISEHHFSGGSRNGCVYVGSRFFMSDQREKDESTLSHLTIGDSETGYTEYCESRSVSDGLYGSIDGVWMPFRLAPFSPDPQPKCYACGMFTSVGTVNVMNYAMYEAADESSYKLAMAKVDSRYAPVCIETTHGVVVKALNDVCAELDKGKIRVTFISPIVDRYLKFAEDVDGKYGKQNFVCSYNGGVATANILQYLNLPHALVK